MKFPVVPGGRPRPRNALVVYLEFSTDRRARLHQAHTSDVLE